MGARTWKPQWGAIEEALEYIAKSETKCIARIGLSQTHREGESRMKRGPA